MTKVKFKDVAHLYVNSEVRVKMDSKLFESRGEHEAIFNGIDWAVSLAPSCRISAYYPCYDEKLCKRSDWLWVGHDRFKPILRPLSDMTEEETRFIYRHIHYSELSYEWRNAIAHLQQRITDGALMVNAELFRYLLSKSFDLFNLIDSKEAIDKTTLSNDQSEK